jgi:NADPH:quinone reductase-like Zn-dependent oxidoreductase
MAEQTGRNRRSVSGILASGLTALPLCPACYPAYAGILSTLGLTALLDTTVQTVLTVLFLSVMVAMLTKPTQEDVGFMKELLESKKVTPVIDRRHRLSEVAEALRYLEERHAQGKVVITV